MLNRFQKRTQAMYLFTTSVYVYIQQVVIMKEHFDNTVAFFDILKIQPSPLFFIETPLLINFRKPSNPPAILTSPPLPTIKDPIVP